MSDQETIDALKKKREAAGDGTTRNPTWDWKETPIFEGKLLEVVPQRMKDASITLRATVKQHKTNDIYTMWLSSTVLLGKFKDEMPAADSLIYVEFAGKQKSEDGQREYNMYHMFAERNDPDFWIGIARLELAKSQEVQSRMQDAVGGGGFAGPAESPF